MSCKKIFASAFLALVMGLGFVFAGVGFLKASAATDVTNEQFKVESMGVRFANGETKHGLRYVLSIDKATWDSLSDKQRKVTAYVAPEYQSAGMYVSDVASAYSFDIGEEDWKLADDESKYTAAVYVSQIPEQAKELRISVQAKLTFVEESVNRTFYTEIKAASMADVAKYAVDNSLAEETKISAYMPSDSTVTFKSGNEILGTDKIAHGAVVSEHYPTIATESNQYVVWNTADGKAWRDGWQAQGDITLTAVVKDYFGKKIDDCLYQTAKVTASAEAASEVAALGFTSAYELKQEWISYKDNVDDNVVIGYAHGSHQTGTDISAYKTVKFAIKTSANYRYDNNEKIYSATTWQIFTLTQTADKVWSVVVTDAEGNAVHSAENLTCDTNTIIDILWTKRDKGYNPYASAKYEVLRVFATEVRGEKRIMDYGITVDGCALNATYVSVSQNPYIKIDKETKAPSGFAIVHKSKLNGATNRAFSTLTLTNYKSISFALKTDGTLKLDKIDPKEQLEVTDGKWVIFTVSMNEDGKTWDIVIKDENGVVLIDAKQVTADRNDSGYVKDSLSSLLWGDRSNGYTWSISEEQTIWATEIRADRKDEIKSVTFGNKIDDVLLFDADKLALNEVVGTTAEGFMASGFEKLYKSGDSVKSYNDRALSDADLSAYSEVRFAVMSNWKIGAKNFNDSGEYSYRWFYYTLKQTADNVWSVTITDDSGKVLGEAKNINGIKSGYVSNSIDEVLWGTGDLFRITVGDASLREGDLVVYCSEIRGTLKKA